MAVRGLSGFEQMARPLLELFQHLTGLETAFVTVIDWAAQRQDVVVALNAGDLEVPEGSTLPWSDSMSRWSVLAGKARSSEVAITFPRSHGFEAFSMRTFVALPIEAENVALGTVCGASRDSVDLDPVMLVSLDLISQALAFQLRILVERHQLRVRAEGAEALALVDPLTGLANRRGFDARFEEELARSGRAGTPVALLAVDLDEFKAVNDTYGHVAGDSILAAVGDVLRKTARVEDIIARTGGDEFAVLLSPGDAHAAETVAERIADEFRAACKRLKIPCTLSIGFGTTDTTPRRSLVVSADDALYRAKAARNPSRTPSG